MLFRAAPLPRADNPVLNPNLGAPPAPPVPLSPIHAVSRLPDPLLPDEGSPQPSTASPHQPASSVLQSREMAQRPPPVLVARSSVRDPKPASVASAPRSTSSPSAKRRHPSKSLPSPLLADRKHSSPARRHFSRPLCSERRSIASPRPQPPEYLKVGCGHAPTPYRAQIATPAESVEACLALRPQSTPAPEESGKDLPRRTPSRHRAAPCHPVHPVPPRKCVSDADSPVR